MSKQFNPLLPFGFDESGSAPSTGTGVPGGSNKQVQFNDGGNFGGNSLFTFDKASGVLTLGPVAGTAGSTVFNGSNFFGIFDGSKYNGISTALPAPTISGYSSAALGGYFSGLGIGGNSNNTGTPTFGILTSTQSGAGLGSVAFTIYDTNKVVTFTNTLDDGSGNVIFGGYETVKGIAAPAVSPAGQGRFYYDSSTNHFYYSENGGAYQQFGSGSGSSSAPAYFQREQASVTTLYEGTNPTTSSVSTSGWALVKTVLTGNNYDTRTIYTASDTWNNRASATYTTSFSYAI